VRVAFVTPRARAVDGWGRYAVELARAVRAFGIQPVFVTADEGRDPSVPETERHAVLPPIFARRFETPRTLFAAPRVRRVLSTCGVVHGIAEPYLPLIALACGAHQPLVQTAHGTWAVRPFDRPLQRPLFRRALRRVDLLVAQSTHTARAVAARVDLPRHLVLPAGVRAEDFARRSHAALPSWAGRGPIVLSVGQVKKRKGVHVALEAAALARRHHPDLQLVVAGPVERHAAYAESLVRRAEGLDMRESFHLVGEVSPDALVAWYQAADVFMLLPVQDGDAFEGLGLVYLEAAAAGVPAIGSRDCGASDAIADGVNGLLVPQNDPAAAADALSRLLGDRSLRNRMAGAARARARALSWTRLAEVLAAHYRELARDKAVH
jgi:glycosyltransferase involved in cell wall biosynthesis